MSRIYTINDAGGKSSGSDLVGCQIRETPIGGYELIDPPNVVLATSPNRTLPVIFLVNNYEGWAWIVTVTSKDHTSMGGTWSNNNPATQGPSEESDSWTASGTGTAGDDEGEDEDEVRAASAY